MEALCFPLSNPPGTERQFFVTAIPWNPVTFCLKHFCCASLSCQVSMTSNGDLNKVFWVVKAQTARPIYPLPTSVCLSPALCYLENQVLLAPVSLAWRLPHTLKCGWGGTETGLLGNRCLCQSSNPTWVPTSCIP